MVIFKAKKKRNMEDFEEKLVHMRHVSDFKNLGAHKPPSSTTTTTQKRKFPLHNFELPSELRWGSQKLLRCMKVGKGSRENSDVSGQSGTKKGCFGGDQNNGSIFLGLGCDFGDRGRGFWSNGFEEDDNNSYYMNCENGLKRERGVGFESPSPEKRLKVVNEGDEIGISAVREKVILDLQNAGDRMKEAILRGGSFEDVAGELGKEERVQPWNLRTRRAMNRPVEGDDGVGVDGVKNLKLDVVEPNVDELRTSLSKVEGETALRRRSGAATPAAGSPSGKEKEREKFSVALGRREVEEDFMAVVGRKPPRRPKKHAKSVQKHLDTLFPGLWLTEVTPDMYKVTETAG